MHKIIRDMYWQGRHSPAPRDHDDNNAIVVRFFKPAKLIFLNQILALILYLFGPLNASGLSILICTIDYVFNLCIIYQIWFVYRKSITTGEPRNVSWQKCLDPNVLTPPSKHLGPNIFKYFFLVCPDIQIYLNYLSYGLTFEFYFIFDRFSMIIMATLQCT